MMMNRSFIRTLVEIFVAIMLVMPLVGCGAEKHLEAGHTWEIHETTNLASLTIADGATIQAPEDYSVTMTVDGVETGIVPGTYEGDIVLTMTETNVVKYKELTHNFRQALYLDKTGVVAAKSVLPAAGDYRFENGILTGANITSVGENFNGIFVKGGEHTIKDPVIDFTGNGGNDFAGYGAAIMASGKDTTLVIDGAKIKTLGAVRPTIVVNRNASVIVKNSILQAMDGVLPPDYVPTTELGYMKEVPWMLGLSGNNRATNLLGRHATATYINSSISSESWGVLSIDSDDESQEKVEADARERKLTAINSEIRNTSDHGYGAYTDCSYYGCDINVGDYAVIGSGVFAASNPEIIAELNTDLDLGLTPEELSSLERKRTHVTSGRFGLMAKGTVTVLDDTVFDTEKAVFLVKGSGLDLNVDGAKGVQLNSKNGIILQIMEDDDPMTIDAIYHEPEDPIKAEDFDVTAINNRSDVIATFANITLAGDFYNGFPGGSSSGAGAPGGPGGGGMPGGGRGEGMPGGPGGEGMPGGGPGEGMPEGPGGEGMPGGGPGGGMGGPASGKNMVLTFSNANITGVVTASRAKHAKDTITSEDYLMLGEVTNTPCPSVNNGVIVSLNSSTWTVTGTSYLTSLTVDEGSHITAPEGYKLSMTVDDSVRGINTGAYQGNIIITVTKS